jgi:hypothetical protein
MVGVNIKKQKDFPGEPCVLGGEHIRIMFAIGMQSCSLGYVAHHPYCST